jgi:hypothetical protein
MAIRATLATLACALLLAGCGSSSSSSSSSSSAAPSTQTSTSSSAQVSYEGVPLQQGQDLAPNTTKPGRVDGIECGATEQLRYHIHAHLAVYVNGILRALTGGIGIPGSVVKQTTEGPVALGGQCIFWLHTHAPDGIIHVESPKLRIYTLGSLFDEWRQPLTSSRVATASGAVTAFFNRKPWTKSIRSIPLLPHAVIQISVGTPIVPFQSMSWSGLQL